MNFKRGFFFEGWLVEVLILDFSDAGIASENEDLVHRPVRRTAFYQVAELCVPFVQFFDVGTLIQIRLPEFSDA